jgi:hypothetical protein
MKQFIPYWNEMCNELFAEFQRLKDNTVVDEFINRLNSERKLRRREKKNRKSRLHPLQPQSMEPNEKIKHLE